MVVVKVLSSGFQVKSLNHYKMKLEGDSWSVGIVNMVDSISEQEKVLMRLEMSLSL